MIDLVAPVANRGIRESPVPQVIDQARFGYLENFDALKGRNAQRVFEELEWE